jgi:hypothetical protein
VAPAGEAAPANVRAARRDERTAPPSAAIPVFQRDILRSLERMEADLAAMRAEVERMRGYVAEAKPANSPESER